MKPLISVIIPARNSEDTIEIAIDAMLHQTYPNLEIIIVDDNSTDGTKEIADRYAREHNNVHSYALPYDDPNRFHERKNKPPVNINAGWMARNYGIEKAKGGWVTFQDADDASFLNRIETQYNAALEYNSNHLCIDWIKLEELFLGKQLNIDKFKKENDDLVVSKEEINKLVKKTKGPLFSALGPLHKYISFFAFKKKFSLRHLFFNSWDSYPCAGNSPFVKNDVFKKVRFRPLSERVWPSGRGRGADRDFNFQVAENFKNSVCIKLPLYLWRVDNQNIAYNKIQWENYIR